MTASPQAQLLASLPPGSQILVTWHDGSQPPLNIIRTGSLDGGAATDQYQLAGTRPWLAIAAWGAEVAVLHNPDEAGDVVDLTDDQRERLSAALATARDAHPRHHQDISSDELVDVIASTLAAGAR